MSIPAVLFMGDLVIVARQAGLIAEARRRGLAPLLVVTPETEPARLAACRADASHPLSGLEAVVTVDDATVDLVFPAVQPLLHRYDVRAVVCVGDLFVEPVGLLAECLGLPGPGATASRICRNKLLQRLAVPGLAPGHRVVAPADRARLSTTGLTYPVVVKPVARFSSLGVRLVEHPAELAGILATYPPDETVLVEERVVGPEFSVEALTCGGETFWAAVTGKQTNEDSSVYFTEMGHLSPAYLPAAQERALLDANLEALRRVGFRDGITHAEFRVSAGGPVLMEVAARLPGDAIMTLWSLATGRSLEPVMLDLALGVPTAYPPPRRRAGQTYLDHPHGRLRDVTSTGAAVSWVERDDRWPDLVPAAPDEPARSRAVLVTRSPGDLLADQTDSTARSVSVVFDAPLTDAAAGFFTAFRAEVTVATDPV